MHSIRNWIESGGMPSPPRNCLATEYVVFIIAEIKAAARDVYQIKSPALHTNQRMRTAGSHPEYFLLDIGKRENLIFLSDSQYPPELFIFYKA